MTRAASGARSAGPTPIAHRSPWGTAQRPPSAPGRTLDAGSGRGKVSAVSHAAPEAHMTMPAAGSRLRGEPFPAHLPDRVLAEAEAVAEAPVALYVVDLDGHCLWRLAG